MVGGTGLLGPLKGWAKIMAVPQHVPVCVESWLLFLDVWVLLELLMARDTDVAPKPVAELPPQPGRYGSQPVHQDDDHLLHRLHHCPHPEGEWPLPHGSGRGGEAELPRAHPCQTVRRQGSLSSTIAHPCFWLLTPALPTPAPLPTHGILGDAPFRASGSAKTHLCSGVGDLICDSERPDPGEGGAILSGIRFRKTWV